MVNIRSVLMDTSHWGDPEVFRPERFIGSDGTFKKDEHLILFGTGLFRKVKYFV
jgi:methyl farnesoate epoxidase / farnesoate epoxidase